MVMNHGRSYINSPDFVKNRKATINLINKKNSKCFQYLVTVALNHEEIRKDLRRRTKVKCYIDKYNFEGTNFPWEKDY